MFLPARLCVESDWGIKSRQTRFKWLCHFGASHSEFPHEPKGRNTLIHRVIAEGGCEVAL